MVSGPGVARAPSPYPDNSDGRTTAFLVLSGMKPLSRFGACWRVGCAALWLALAGLAPAWGRGGGGCLEQGSLILTPAGPRRIEELRAGDPVWTAPEGRWKRATAQAVIEVQPEGYLELDTTGGSLRVTPEHPIGVSSGVFCRAAALRPGDRLEGFADSVPRPLTLLAVRWVPAARPAYNLLVNPGGTYLVRLHSAGLATLSLLVHNKGCFLPDTPVLRADGTPMMISAVRPGQRLLAFTSAGETVATAVERVIALEVDASLVVRLEHRLLRVTPEHPFYVGAGRFMTIGALRVGDAVYAYDGTGLRPQRILDIERVPGRVVVFNLQTAAPHTFFADGIAVHNKGGFGGGGFHGGGFRGGGYRGGYYGGTGGSGNQGLRLPHPARALALAALVGALLGAITRGVRRYAEGVVRQTLKGGVHGAIAGFLLLLVAMVSVPLAFFLAVGLLTAWGKRAQRRSQNLDFTYSRGQIERKRDKTVKLVQFISRVDPNFTRERLTAVAQATFTQLQKCWQAREYGPMEPLLMPDLYRVHCAQLRGLERDHEFNRLESLRVEAVDLVHVRYTHAEHQRHFTALITASARDYYVDDRTGQFRRGDSAPARFQEFWTFQWREGSWRLREIEQSRESDALKAENFFEQFTEQGLRQIYAEADHPGGPAGPWLDQNTETKVTRVERLLNFLVTTDRLWDRAAMLDRAREVFAQVMLAQEAGDPAAMPATDLFPEVAEHLAAELSARREQGTTIEYRNLCVRKLELILVRNYRDNTRDEYTVRIHAHAQKVVHRRGLLIQQDEDVEPFEEYWTFGRLDNQWKLKEVLLPAEGEAEVREENVDEESSPEQLQWYYQQTRPG